LSRREPYLSWRKNNFVRVLIQTGSKRDPRLPDVPTLYELMDEYKTPESSRRLAKLILASGDLGRPIMAPPGVLPDRVKILRQAFMKALADPELLAQAEKQNMEVEPTSGEDLEALAKEVMTQPPEIIERMKKLLGK
jgi:tripartite-type tricarboxylate transporter receptor subunit TctC